MAATRAAFPTDEDLFSADTRVYFAKESNSYHLEDENGQEWEWIPRAATWTQVTDEALEEKHRAQYDVEGVDESEPAFDTTRKRKAAEEAKTEIVKKQKQNEVRRDHKNTAIFVTGLPLDTDEAEIYDVFGKYGLIAESWDTDKPRIKMYYDDQNEFKGEALIIYFKPESVPQAIEILDETDFRAGPTTSGSLRVNVAEKKFKNHKETLDEGAPKTKTLSENDKKKMKAKEEEMNRRLNWDSDEEEEEARKRSSRWDRLMVIKGMFTLEELKADPALYFDIKDDLREQCEEFGEVTNVVLFDEEADGVMTVRFSDPDAAKQCVRVMDGRKYEYRTLKAYIASGNERFKKSGKSNTTAEDEAERIAAFSKDISKGS